MPRYGPADSLKSPRFTGPSTVARLPHVEDLDGVDLAITGVPFDTGVSYRVGGRFGPAAVRDASMMLRPYNPNLAVAPFEVLSCVDHGDIAIVPGYIEPSYAAIETAVRSIVTAGVVPLLIGGDHACTLAHLRAMATHGPVAVIDFDPTPTPGTATSARGTTTARGCAGPSRRAWSTSSTPSKSDCGARFTARTTGSSCAPSSASIT
jgi:agmatinase